MKEKILVACLLVLCTTTTLLAQVANPVPQVNLPLVPTSTTPGSSALSLTVNGTGFVRESIVNWNGTPRKTEFISSTRLGAAILSSDVTKKSTATVTVSNPSPGGGVSNVAFFQITPTIPTVSWTRSDFATAEDPRLVITADLNGDGKLDFVTANDVSDVWIQSYVSVLLGNGEGTFQPRVDYHLGGLNIWRVTTGDFNADGVPDLAAINLGHWSLAATRTFSILLGEGNGIFHLPTEYPLSPNQGAGFIATGDFNKDGNLDLVVGGPKVFNYTCIGTPGCLVESNFTVFFGDGTGSFNPGTPFFAGINAEAAVAADFDGDGNLDLAVTNNNYPQTYVSVLHGNGDGTFKPKIDYPTDYNPARWIIASDFSGDGNLDLVTANSGAGTVSILVADGHGGFLNHADYTTGSGYLRQPFAAEPGDFNADGKLDLAVVNAGSGTVSLLLGHGDGTFQPFEESPIGPYSSESLIAGDYNDDGRLDLAVANTHGWVSVLLQTPAQNQPPIAVAESEGIVECMSQGGSTVTLGGSKSSDPDGDTLTFEWKDGAGNIVGTTAVIDLSVPLGVHTFTLIVTDPDGLSDSATAQIMVRDTMPPVLSVVLSPNVLWPPNHKLVNIAANVQASDMCDPNPAVRLVSITSTEPDSGGDIQGVSVGTDDRTFLLRAERSGNGNGRVYVVTYQATDHSGNLVHATAQALVPHDQGASQ